VDPAVAGEIVTIASEAGARIIVDIHSEALRRAVEQRPWMVKCNRVELQALLGVASDDRAPVSRVAQDMQRLRREGVEVVVTSLGAEGVLLAERDGVSLVRVPAVEVVNATGSGDLLLAGLCAGLEQGRPVREAVVLGAACGTAGATQLAPELPAGFERDDWTDRLSLEAVEQHP
jgi:fructose-1-phosphate kinase PfkB-like protein